jgi:hypothetical protein
MSTTWFLCRFNPAALQYVGNRIAPHFVFY